MMKEGTPVSENSTVRLGLIMALIGLFLAAFFSCAGALGGAIWWGSSLQTKMDIVINRLDSSALAQSVTQKEISDIKERVIVLEQKKTP